MALTDIAAVRLNTADKARIKREAWTGDGDTTALQLDLSPVMASPAPRVWSNNVQLALTTDYTLDLDNGIVTFVLTPTVNDEIVVEYYASVFSDIEIDHFLSVGGGNVWLASAYLLLAMAVDAARIARRETLSGGGGFGTTTIDTSVRARELREQAKGYVNLYEKTAGDLTSAEGITQIAWTDAMGARWTADQLLEGVGIGAWDF